jgi:hypothetical protein
MPGARSTESAYSKPAVGEAAPSPCHQMLAESHAPPHWTKHRAKKSVLGRDRGENLCLMSGIIIIYLWLAGSLSSASESSRISKGQVGGTNPVATRKMHVNLLNAF